MKINVYFEKKFSQWSFYQKKDFNFALKGQIFLSLNLLILIHFQIC